MKYFLSALLFSIIISCDKKQDKNDEEVKKPLLSIVNEYSSVIKVRSTFNKDVEDWSELKAVDNFLERYKKVSPKEVLSNALELRELVKSLRDSLNHPLFNNPSFKTRVNIFYNETLRLSDMAAIPAIKAEEVNYQTEKVIDAFSAVNSKINSTLSKKRFEEEINIDLNFIGLDSTKIDSVSKKSIKKEVLKTPVNNRKLNYKKRPMQ